MSYKKSGAIVVFIAALVAFLIWYTQFREPSPPVPQPGPLAMLPEAPAPEPPPTHYPVPDSAPVAPPSVQGTPPAPDTEDSFRDSAQQLVGPAPFDSLLVPEALIRHIVVTVDNLPRERTSVSLRPFKRVPGDFAVTPAGASYVIDPANNARYEPLVHLVTGLSTTPLVALYFRYYPFFQKAYQELGYPEGYFNDRLVVAIDNLLATPEPQSPIQLVRPNVYYQFADPALENASAGQKLLLRLSPEDRASVKTKLAAIRAQIVAGKAGGAALPK